MCPLRPAIAEPCRTLLLSRSMHGTLHATAWCTLLASPGQGPPPTCQHIHQQEHRSRLHQRNPVGMRRPRRRICAAAGHGASGIPAIAPGAVVCREHAGRNQRLEQQQQVLPAAEGRRGERNGRNSTVMGEALCQRLQSEEGQTAAQKHAGALAQSFPHVTIFHLSTSAHHCEAGRVAIFPPDRTAGSGFQQSQQVGYAFHRANDPSVHMVHCRHGPQAKLTVRFRLPNTTCAQAAAGAANSRSRPPRTSRAAALAGRQAGLQQGGVAQAEQAVVRRREELSGGRQPVHDTSGSSTRRGSLQEQPYVHTANAQVLSAGDGDDGDPQKIVEFPGLLP